MAKYYQVINLQVINQVIKKGGSGEDLKLCLISIPGI